MNIGLIGFGFMGKTHAYAIQNLRYYYKNLPFDAKITAVCTRSESTAKPAAEEYGFGHFSTSEDELISDPTIDVIDICTPNICHYETIKKAVAAKKHIYCEKPLCLTYAQAAECASLAAEAKIHAAIVFNYRFLPPVLRAKQLVDDGRIGRPLSFRCSYLHSSCVYPDRAAGWKQDRKYGGGVLYDLGSHAADLMYYLLGEFDEVDGRSQIAYPKRLGVDGKPWVTDADEAFYMIARLKNGAVGTIEANKLAVGTNDDLHFEIYGDRGALKFDLMDPNWLWFYDDRDQGGDYGGEKGFRRIECVGRYQSPGGVFPSVKAPIGWIRGHVESYCRFLESVASGTDFSPSFDDAAHIQLVMEKAYESDEQKKRLTV